ncbi:MAG: hypothetical protein KIT84_22110 [Labilithrix sp.]|nr:hypothetical protein [Labilithrix sp.]MCW5813740.1 hypothetical protein [Labilithrix sp.]
MLLACEAPVAARKTVPAAACEEGTSCPEQQGPRPAGGDRELPVTPVVPDRDPPPVEKPDAAPPSEETLVEVEATPKVGPSCAKLEECCANLRKAGITGSANQCDSVVADRNEVSCASVNEDYMTPDEFYDPVCF